MELHWNSSGRAATFGMTGWQKLPQNRLAQVLWALVDNGPLAISVSASASWNWYGGGILDRSSCPQEAIVNHAVTLIGYGKQGGQGYWHILNSWGTYWGEAGYIRLQRSDDEEAYCGWYRQPQLGTACDGETNPVWVCGTCGVLYDVTMPKFEGSPTRLKDDALMC